jgi:AcrR family transcriptional regulator
MSSSKTATVVIGDQVFSRDGRRRRRETNRNRVVEATAKLIREGNPTPTAGDVAEQAEVSERSIFRYFDDVDALLQAAMSPRSTTP